MTAAPEPRVEGRVLIVDGDYDTLGALARALRNRGHQVVLAADGRAGIQRAVEVAPDVVLIDREVVGLDYRTFLEVLRDNPRTSAASTFIMGRGEVTALANLDARAEPIVKPFNSDEIAARIDDTLRGRFGPAREPELRGDLQQVALFDLVQVFAANRRTGRLQVTSSVGVGELWVTGGRVVDAAYRGSVGEKALFRLLGVRNGRFIFAPGLEAERERIDAPTDRLLMEAAHTADEIERMLERLPAAGSLLSLAETTPVDVSPLAGELMAELAEPRAIDEVLDVLPASDLAILAAIEELLSRSALRVFDPSGQQVSLGDADEALALRAAAARLRRPGLEGPARIAVLSDAAVDVTRFARALDWVEQFVASTVGPMTAGRGAMGSLGVIRFDGADTELFALPLDPTLRPLWGALLTPCRVALLLSDGPPSSDVEELCASLDVRVVRAPAGWERPAGAAAAVRTALTRSVARTPPPR